jgi:hypothetical protein
VKTAGAELAAFLWKKDGNCHQVFWNGEGKTYPTTTGFLYVGRLLALTELQRTKGIDGLVLYNLGVAAPPAGDSPEGLTTNLHSKEGATDPNSLIAYEDRLREIWQDLGKIEKNGEKHPGQKDELTAECSDILNHVHQATGMTTEKIVGRLRAGKRLADLQLREIDHSARDAAIDCIRKARDKCYETLEKDFPELVRHLRESIKSEKGCFTYLPLSPIAWRF